MKTHTRQPSIFSRLRLPVTTILIIASILSALLTHFARHDSSLQCIQKRGIITVLTTNNANTYYIYKEKPMGFEYDLARAFADYLGVKLAVVTPGWSRLLDSLNNRQGDFIAAGMTRTHEREKIACFSNSYLPVQQKIIIHKTNRTITGPNDLNGKIIHIREGTSYQQRLEQLQAGGIEPIMVLHKDIATEELIQKVAEKKIAVTVADSNIAFLNRRYYPDVKIAFPIEKEQHLGWAVRRGDKRLLNKINNFFKQIKQDGTYDKIYNRYYSAVDTFDYVDLKTFHERIYTRLPAYRSIIQQQAEKYGFDWRLIAAVIYQESHFDPLARSHTEVRGIMQLTQTTAKEMGVTNRFDPLQSIRGGVKYLSKMRGHFDNIEDPHTRLLFGLASYNIGYGHVRDAQQIAREMGMDPTNWASLKKTLPLLRNRKYYQHTSHGYARGTEPVRYVERILTYYDILKQKAVDQTARESTRQPRKV